MIFQDFPMFRLTDVYLIINAEATLRGATIGNFTATALGYVTKLELEQMHKRLLLQD
jgi:hypothetical protein